MNKNHVMRNAAIASALLLALFGSKANAAGPFVDLSTITATMDGGTAKNGNTWYDVGVNTSSNTTGLVTGLISGQSDPLSTYLIQPAKGNNVLMLDSANKSGTLTFQRAFPLDGLSLAGSSGNGTGTITNTILHFTDGTTSAYNNKLGVGDWFGNTPIVETAKGRIQVDATTASGLFNNVGANNPRIVSTNLVLSIADSAKLITAIDFSWTGGTTTHTAIFGVSGDFTGSGHFTAIPLAPGSFNQDVIVGASEVVPEPGTLALLGLGAAGLFVGCRRKKS